MHSQADAVELSLHPQNNVPEALLDQAAALFQHHAALQDVTVSVDTTVVLPELWWMKRVCCK